MPRGREFQIAVVVNIAGGFHMNSHKPSDAYLIATTLTPMLPAGITLVDTLYPLGHLEKFAFSPKEPLDVYTGSVTLRPKLSAQSSAPLGARDDSHDLALPGLQPDYLPAAREGAGERATASRRSGRGESPRTL